MAGIGALMVVLGIGSLLLPMFDIQFTLMSMFDEAQPVAGIAVAAIGAVLLFLTQRRKAAQPAPLTPQAPPPLEPPAS